MHINACYISGLNSHFSNYQQPRAGVHCLRLFQNHSHPTLSANIPLFPVVFLYCHLKQPLVPVLGTLWPLQKCCMMTLSPGTAPARSVMGSPTYLSPTFPVPKQNMKHLEPFTGALYSEVRLLATAEWFFLAAAPATNFMPPQYSQLLLYLKPSFFLCKRKVTSSWQSLSLT